ncbi:hypothetical protein AVEN_145287-1 [Araneus ventricosus]|uniref:Uncharacterized protein n=1 Tax=Araneus ventricosus TaxID=182803 RepID=A0A4Y2GZU6_ARAVE|nr:hypothetical protein AVEN_145287-1 [Araneus ventricosus]
MSLSSVLLSESIALRLPTVLSSLKAAPERSRLPCNCFCLIPWKRVSTISLFFFTEGNGKNSVPQAGNFLPLPMGGGQIICRFSSKLLPTISDRLLCLLIIDTDICKIPGYPLLKCQKVVADRFSEVDGEWLLRRSSSLVNPALYFVTGEKF